ncbi:MAG: prepilin peptidase [Gammaproteobacteria bacterium]|nr:prepilin peptidase [Gammaproteobacteria bacterium]
MNYYYLMILILAYLVGSMLNMVMYRLPFMLDSPRHQLNLFFPGSHCPHCKAKVRYWHNLPIFGFLILRGRCKDCKQLIHKRYLIIEMLYPLLVWIVAQFTADEGNLLIFAWIWALLLTLSVIDLEHLLLPDPLNYLLLWTGLILNLYTYFCSINEAIWGGIIGYMSLWLFYHGFRFVSGKGKKELMQAKPFGPMLAAAGLIYYFALLLAPVGTEFNQLFQKLGLI